MTEHTPTPWSLRGKGILGDAGTKIVLAVSATSTCGRAGDDYYACKTSSAEADLYLNEANASFIVKAVNSHDALVKALKIFLGEDDRFQVAVGGNPLAVEKMLAETRALVGGAPTT